MKTPAARTLVVTLALSFAILSGSSVSAAPQGKSYSTPEEAVGAFVGALRKNDLPALVTTFGKGSERLFESEDPVADKNIRADFLKFYDAAHEIRSHADGSKTLVVGVDAWPFPVPLVKSGRGWAFDTDNGLDEIINRRIGRNELATIQTCLAVADAQREYYSMDRDGDGILEFAQQFGSVVGLRNGLFWPVAEGEPLSPLGVFVAMAAQEGYSTASDNYHGYHYRMLFSQGPSAPGGAYDYKVRENQIGGFAVLAYPAAYGDSGIMTFMLSHSGIIYQRDLGEATAEEALKITRFDGEGWTEVEEKDKAPLTEP